MNKSAIALYAGGILIIVIAIFGIYKFNGVNTVVLPLKNDPLNTSYKISGKDYTLVNGKVEKEIVHGSASKEVVAVFGVPVYGDLDGDGDSDAVMFLTQNSGGSGTFYYVAEAVNDAGIYKGTSAMLLGDRISPQNINIQDGLAVVNYAERKTGEDFSLQPSVGKSLFVKLDSSKLELGEVVQNFEGEADPSKMTLGMKVWQWESINYSDGKKITANSDKFKLTFKNDGTFGAGTDCNGVGGEYTVKGNKITFSNMISTMMYCEGSQEKDFSKALSETDSFMFTSKGELVLNLKMDSGSVIFR